MSTKRRSPETTNIVIAKGESEKGYFMSSDLNLLVLCSIAGLLLILGFKAKHTAQWKIFGIELAILTLFVVFLNMLFGFPYPSTALQKGAADSLFFYGVLYLFVLVGILSQFSFRYLSQPKASRPAWDWGMFIAPVFAAPLIFFPLVAAFQNAGIDFQHSPAPRLMIFLIAFQNGFFWKEVLEHKYREEKQKK